jgi:lysophospholipid acyltransferase (LPLAT)-like uncharacterized protein
VSLRKRLLETPFALVLTSTLTRAYRWFLDASLHRRHDPRLLAWLRGTEPAIFAVWHQDFAHTCGYLSRWNSRRRTWVLASASRDGGLAAAAAAGVGFRGAVRGSSARGGAAALLGLHRLLGKGGASCVVVCDGPRPPAMVMKPGILHLASATGLPIWLVRTSYRPAWILRRSWARFVVPRPSSLAVSLADGPIRLPADLDREGLERHRADLEQRLRALAERADLMAERGAAGGTARACADG